MELKQEDKKLLLQDLCARLPYYPKCEMIDELRVVNNEKDSSYISTLFPKHIELFSYHNNFIIKPYLRPMSSMTDEEEIEYDATFVTIKLADGHYESTMTYKSFDFLNAHHFDFRGLIDRGLAIDCTGLNIY